MKFKATALLLAAALVFLFASCRKKEAETVPAEETSSMINAYFFSGENAESYEELQQEIETAEAFYGLAKLGNAAELKSVLTADTPDYEKAGELLQERITRSRLAEKYPFLQKMPPERIVCIGDGTELFLAVPGAEADGVAVYQAEMNGERPGKGAPVVSYDGAYPVLILADSFHLEGKNGSVGEATVSRDADFPEGTLNISFEAEPLTEKDLTGCWKAEKVTDDAGYRYDLYLEFDPDHSFRYYYVGADADIWEDKTIMHFAGTWKVLRDKRVALETTADGGSYMESGVPAYDSDGEYDMVFGDAEKKSLLVTYVSGDRFFTGIAEDEILFERTE